MLLTLLMPIVSAASASRPNIVVLLADDLGYGELGCQGNPEIPTPHIDSIAANGMRCTQAYVTAPNCSPSRAGFLTGRIPTRFGYEFNPIGAGNEDLRAGLPPAERTLAETLHDLGYTTALIGKWHLGGTARFHPQRHGFDAFFGFMHEGHYFVPPPWRGVTTMLRRRTLPGGGKGRWVGGDLIYTTHMGHDEPAYDADNPILRAGQPVEEQAYLTDAFTREAVDFLNRNRDKPFFLYLAYNAVHSPLQGAAAYMERFSHLPDIHRRIFAAMLANLDDSVGTVLSTLRTLDLERETLLFFLSDNGGPTRELTSSNKPLRGEKGQMYEGGIRVPFMLQWPGVLPAGRTYPRPVSSMDIYPTAVRAAGGTPAAGLDGVDLAPYLTGKREESPHKVLFWRQGWRKAVRVGDWKLVCMSRPNRPVSWELYNLADDVSESQNLAHAQPEKRAECLAVWNQYNGDMSEPIFSRGW
jgi:arylsulfatase B